MIETIITALVAGAAKSAVDIGSDALKSSYASLKTYLANKYSSVDVKALELDPDDDRRRTRLVTELGNAMTDQDPEIQKLSKAVLQQATIAYPQPSGSSILDDPDGPLPVNLNIDAKIPLIQRFPVGPPVPTHFISIDDLADALSDEVNSTRIVALIRRTEALRLKYDPEGATKSATVNLHDLPNPDGSAFDFWFQAIDEARRKGPRTLTSFLLCIPMGAWIRFGRDAFKTLEGEYCHG